MGIPPLIVQTADLTAMVAFLFKAPFAASTALLQPCSPPASRRKDTPLRSVLAKLDCTASVFQRPRNSIKRLLLEMETLVTRQSETVNVFTVPAAAGSAAFIEQ